jgi:hypothetical protein
MKNESSQRLIHSINFDFVENIPSKMTQTPIKYFNGELMCFRRGSTVLYIDIFR